jgi:hypothetical protein
MSKENETTNNSKPMVYDTLLDTGATTSKIASFILNCFQYRSLVVSVGILTLIRMYVDNAVIRATMLIAAIALIVSVSINIFLWLRSKVNN